MATYVTALVLQQNTSVYISPAGPEVEKVASVAAVNMVGIGLLMPVPTPDNGAVIDYDAWAIPTVDNGIFTGWTFKPYNLNDPAQTNPPTVQSFAVTRVWDRLMSDVWVFVGTSAQYLTAAGGGAALPTTLGNNVFQVACQILCQWNSTNQYFGLLALPSLVGNERYYPFGFFNNVALALGTSTGYISAATLLTFLNTSWTSVGTWSLSADNRTLIVTQTAGPGTDTLCARIGTVNPSL